MKMALQSSTLVAWCGRARWRTSVLLLGLLGSTTSLAALTVRQLALVVNDADPLSVDVARYYQQARGIPAEHVIHLRFAPQRSALSAAEFAPLRTEILAHTAAGIEAYAIAWTQPYRVDCLSITSALTLGPMPGVCPRPSGCQMTPASPLFDYNSEHPLEDLGLRPSMLLAASDFSAARALIDRGVRSDGTRPQGSALYAVTTDVNRSRRTAAFVRAARLRVPGLNAYLVRGDRTPTRNDVLFYFTGLQRVAELDHLHFLPGAVADHLTSFGGMLTDSPQMSAMRWLEAGATGSYGTVAEPCAFPQKFPDPAVLVRRYTRGETLIEAYWKSVSSPAEGVFIGEPLAAPWGPSATR